jgi:hypothetical protein
MEQSGGSVGYRTTRYFGRLDAYGCNYWSPSEQSSDTYGSLGAGLTLGDIYMPDEVQRAIEEYNAVVYGSPLETHIQARLSSQAGLDKGKGSGFDEGYPYSYGYETFMHRYGIEIMVLYFYFKDMVIFSHDIQNDMRLVDIRNWMFLNWSKPMGIPIEPFIQAEIRRRIEREENAYRAEGGLSWSISESLTVKGGLLASCDNDMNCQYSGYGALAFSPFEGMEASLMLITNPEENMGRWSM